MADWETHQQLWSEGEAYEPYVGRWSRLVAREFVGWLNAQPHKRWLDVGCGTGALTGAILDTASPSAVVGIDPSPAFIEYATAHIEDSRVQFRVGDAQELKAGRGEFDMVVSGLVLNFVPNPERMLTEMMRACRLNGRVALYVWDYAGEMQMMRYFWDAAVELDAGARALDEGVRFPIADPKRLWNLFLDAGLNDVSTRAIDVPTHFRDFDDFWLPFTNGRAPAPGHAMSLSEERRALLRAKLESRLPIERDGSIKLMARAWAVRGSR
jgi:SAM-dependent methyltransferase